MHIKSLSTGRMSPLQVISREVPYFSMIGRVSSRTCVSSSGTDTGAIFAFFFMESSVSSFLTMVSSQWSWASILVSSASCFSSGR